MYFQLLIAIVLASLNGSISFASKEASAQSCAQSFAVLSRHEEASFGPEKVMDIARLRPAVTVIGGGKSAAKDIENGTYVYLVDKSGVAVYMNRLLVPPQPGGSYIGSHESLYLVLKDLLGKEPELVGAGEFVARNSTILKVTNRSGSFRGGPEHLDHSVTVLKENQLAITEKTFIDDYSKKNAEDIIGEAHISAKLAADLELEYATNPHKRRIASFARQVMRDSYSLDIDKIMMSISKRYSDAEQPRAWRAAQFLNDWEKHNDTDIYRIHQYWDNNDQEFLAMLQLIQDWKKEAVKGVPKPQ
jgi:hypothetical protein